MTNQITFAPMVSFPSDQNFSIGYFSQTISIYNHLEKSYNIGKEGLINLYKDMGNVSAKLDQFNDALQHYRKSIQFAKEILPNTNNTGFSATLNDLANLCAKFEKYELALEYYDKAIAINKSIASDLGQTKSLELSTNYHGIGNVYLKMAQFEKALGYYKKAKEISSACLKGDKNLEVGKSLYQIAYTHRKKGDYNSAYMIFEECLSTFNSIFKKDPHNEYIVRTKKEMERITSYVNREEIDQIIKELN
jgi:tetratricopeptide (TPR) repeat protein